MRIAAITEARIAWARLQGIQGVDLAGGAPACVTVGGGATLKRLSIATKLKALRAECARHRAHALLQGPKSAKRCLTEEDLAKLPIQSLGTVEWRQR